MKETVKKGLITTLTLGAIVLGAGAIIGVTSAFTSPYVYAHSLAARLEAVKGVFPDADDVGEPEEINADGLVERYTVKKAGEIIGWAYSANGVSVTDTVDIMIGINSDFSLGRVEVTSSSSNSTYMDAAKEWLNGVNAGTTSYDDIPVGAGGTKTKEKISALIQAAINNAKANAGGSEVSEELRLVRNVFPDATETDEGTAISLSGGAHQSNYWELTKRYEVGENGETVGYAYEGAIDPMSQQGSFILGIKADGTFSRLYAVEISLDDHDGLYTPTWITGTYIPEINSGTRNPDDCVGGGATITAQTINAMIEAAETDVSSLGDVEAGGTETGSSSEETATVDPLTVVQSVFADADAAGTAETIDANGLIDRYEAKKGTASLGWAYRASAKSKTDTVSIIIAVNSDLTLGRLAVADDATESKWMTAAEGWLNGVNSGDVDYNDTIIEKDVASGGTISAQTMQTLVKAALAHASEAAA